MRNSVPTANPWGDIVGYSRAVRVGTLVFVSGTTASGPEGEALHPGEPGPQARLILKRIEAALLKLGATLKDVVETRIFLCDIARWEEVGRIHGNVFADIRPTTTLVEVSRLIGPGIMVEISAIAVVDSGAAPAVAAAAVPAGAVPATSATAKSVPTTSVPTTPD